MGLLGGGDDSLAATSGWGVLPPINSSADWGSSGASGSSSTANHWSSSSSNSTVTANSAGSSSNTSSSGTAVGRQNALSNHNSASDQLSSSPKPSASSWAQAAGKGLVNTAANTAANGNSSSNANGPNSSSGSGSTNSHETGQSGQQQQQQCPSSSQPSSTTNANLNGGLGAAMNASNSNNSSNVTCSSSSAFQSSSNSNSTTGGLIGGSSSNPIDAAAVNKQRSAGPPAPGQISDLIGQLSDDFRETLLTEKWGSSVINQDSPWNLPPSPQSSPKDTSTWRCPVNSGTEIWENTVRQKKGSSSASLSSSVGLNAGAAQPWAAPTSHIGGTWGEEEDSSNHWTGVPQSSSLNSVSSVGGVAGLGVSGLAGGPGGLSALGGVNSSSINPNWSAGSALSNGAGSGISSYSLLNPVAAGLGAAGLGANSIGAGDGAASWNGNNDKSAFESRAKAQASNWGNFDQSDSVSESGNWDKSCSDSNAFGTWNAPDMSRKEGGWDKESNDSFKGGVDDGTACWGNPGSGGRAAAPPAGHPRPVSNWKDQKYGNKNGYNNNGWSNNGNGNGGNKSANQMLTRTWTDASGHRKSPSMWNDDTKSLNGNMTPNNWSDGQIDTSSWGASKPTKPLTREMILSSKQFHLLVDLGHKKDAAENALRNCQLRFEDALAELENAKSRNSSAYGPMGLNKPMGPMGGRNQPLGPMLNTPTNPSSLQNLVQRIQLAVSTGFLNPQILNQPLSNQNLEIISELLHQIKILKEVQTNAAMQANGSIKSSFEYRIREIKQNIAQLQNQLRSEANTGPGKMGGMQSSMDLFGAKANSDIYGAGLANDGFIGSGNGGAPTAAQGSRLFNWKNKQHSNEESKMNPLSSDFIRAPGGLQKQNSNWGNFMDDNSGWPSDLSKHDKQADLTGGLDDYSLGGNFAPVQDSFDSYKSTWKPTAKSGLVDDDPRSPISQNAMLKDSMFSWNSVGPTNPNSNKANSLLGGNGQGQMDPFGFGAGSSNPWSYNSNSGGQPSSGNAPMPFSTSDLSKKNSSMAKSNSHTWSNQGLNSDYSDSLWNPGANSSSAGGNNGGSGGTGKPRPPPGLSKNSNPSSANSIWSNGSDYLRLRNLTPQIDGSTLKTLCLQHGPLHLFHLFLSQGTAIARYANRDQATKAQSALNNCVLGNTTILADLPPESEVQTYLQHINGGGYSSNGGSSSNGTNGASSHNHQSQSAPSHHQHHASHHSQAYNPSWSNGTNASQATAGAGVGGSASTPQSQHAPSVSLYSRTSSVGSGPNSASSASAAHMSPFGTTGAINSFAVQPTSSPASTLPYGAGAPGGLVTTHSSTLPYNVLNQASVAAASAATQFNKMDNGLLSSWNTTGSGGLWDSSLSGGAGSLWSTAGFSAADRNTPIQNFLPNDLLAGENN